jgi:hypothetical protein
MPSKLTPIITRDGRFLLFIDLHGGNSVIPYEKQMRSKTNTNDVSP